MPQTPYNALVVLGPTASGKTTLGVQLARMFGGEVVSADSRQVYRGLDIGSGKDLDEYVVDGASIPYHLIDIVDLSHEFSVFEYQKRFFEVFRNLESRDALPVVVGGTGLYLDAVLKGYAMVEVLRNESLRAELEALSDDALAARLLDLKGAVHNTTDTSDRDRLVRAIEIADYERDHEPLPGPEIRPLILGTEWPRAELHDRIGERLVERLDSGMIEEVEALLASGVSTEKLYNLGLEYRYVSDFLSGKIKSKNDLKQKLRSAIINFAKRQGTWFRRTERNGTTIHWIERADLETAIALCRNELTPAS